MTQVSDSPKASMRSRFKTALADLPHLRQNSLTASAYCLYINRPAGRVFAAMAATVGATPNGVSVLSGLVSLTGLVILVTAPVTPWVGFVVAALLVLGFMLDSADGQLARLQNSSSSAGEWIDHVIDCATKLAMHAAVLIAWYEAGERGAILLVPLAFQFVSVLLFFGGILVGKMREHGEAALPGAGGLVRSLILVAVDHGVLCATFVVWGWPDAFRAVYVVFLAITTVYLLAMTFKWLREMR